MKKEDQTWRNASQIFHERATEYDQWFDESLLYKIELQALQEIQTFLPGPKLEIGVGPGRFAHDLGIFFGIDPALNPLCIAKERGVAVCRAVGEALPVRTGSIGSLYILFALCFMADPQKVVAECYRDLQDKGMLVLGIINAESPWGAMLNQKKREGHPFYKYAMFYGTETVTKWFDESGFEVLEARSSLLQTPDKLKTTEISQTGIVEQAGFVVLVGCKR